MTTTRPRLREFREARGWTQQDVAEQVARLRSIISCGESGGRGCDGVPVFV